MFGPSQPPYCFSLHWIKHNRFPLSSSLQQLAADPQSWTEVYAVLKGTSLFCYHRQEDVEANVEPAFTIAVNKVGEGSAEAARGERISVKVLFYFWRSVHPHTNCALFFPNTPRAIRTQPLKNCGFLDRCQFSSYINW